MLVPAIGPLALARVAPPAGMHCMRKPLQDASTSAAEPAMHCHHAAAESGTEKNAASQMSLPEASVRSLDCCCQNHDCCRGLKTSEWARPASNLLSVISFFIEPALPTPVEVPACDALTGPDSARAPPRI